MDSQAEDPRTHLAKDRTSFAKCRTQLALDRTTLAWIRTALTMGTFGFGTVGFFRSIRQASPTPESKRTRPRESVGGLLLTSGCWLHRQPVRVQVWGEGLPRNE